MIAVCRLAPGRFGSLRGLKAFPCAIAPLYRCDKPVTSSRKRFKIPRVFRVVGQRDANLIHAKIDAAVEIDECIPIPQSVLNFFSAHDLSSATDQERQHAERLRLQLGGGFPLCATRR